MLSRGVARDDVGYKYSKDMVYISTSGTKTEVELTEPGLSAVKIGNTLYVPRNWDGIATVEIH